ncbi:hypothetical protein M1446_03620 [Candidatus Dependentiae bacterium]|nr:hypothetical protein [Candidatus Dependentiae bacterium]
MLITRLFFLLLVFNYFAFGKAPKPVAEHSFLDKIDAYFSKTEKKASGMQDKIKNFVKNNKTFRFIKRNRLSVVFCAIYIHGFYDLKYRKQFENNYFCLKQAFPYGMISTGEKLSRLIKDIIG